MDNGTNGYRRFLEGDSDGIVEIIKDYKDGLIFFLNGIVQNLYTAEELTEETFVKLVVKKPRFSEKCSFKTWLYTIGRNIALDYIRANSRISDVPIDEYHHMSNDEDDLEKSYIREEQRIIVHKALAKLKSEYRQVLYLIYFEGFDNKQAATVMKKSKRQIENLIYQAKRSLKSELLKENFNYEEL